MAEGLRKHCSRRWEALKRERSSWINHWRLISEVLLPRSGRFLVTENNRGDLRHASILDNWGTRALRTLSGGMMAGMTSPARPWFRLTTRNPDLDESPNVKAWLSKMTTLMLMIYNRSNVYRSLQMAYEELGAFGTCSVILLDDYDTVIHCMPLTIGEYAIATSARGEVNTCYREFRMTVAALVEEFGYENISQTARKLYDQGNYDEWITVVNAIEPRDYRDFRKRDAKNMPYRSVYFEDNGLRPGADGPKGVLRESGFRTFPTLSARWNATGGDIYGTGPGMEALGDMRQLQSEQMYKSKAIASQADPAIQVSADMRNQEANLVPGGIVYVDNPGQSSLARAVYDVRPDIQGLMMDVQDMHTRIDQAFYKDIFMMIAGSQNDRMTATEIAERHEEKMLMLGPVLERLNAELLTPLIKSTFQRLVVVHLVPELPQELNGVDLQVDFVSILAQAQRAVITNSIDRFTQNLGQLAAVKPEVLDKFNADAWADIYADALGIDPELVVANKQVALIRQQRAEAQAQQAKAEQAQQMAGVAKDLSMAQANAGDLRQTSQSPAEIMGQFAGW